MVTIDNSCLIRINFDKMEFIKGNGIFEITFADNSTIPEIISIMIIESGEITLKSFDYNLFSFDKIIWKLKGFNCDFSNIKEFYLFFNTNQDIFIDNIKIVIDDNIFGVKIDVIKKGEIV